MFQNMEKWSRSFFGKRERLLAIFVILLGSFLLILPQLWTRGVIVGSDFLFHYNRFYETAQQIKTGNYSYFLSLYGFQQSGRIINALYGPYFAYLQGMIVLLCRNWFTYQVVSRFLLSSIAGLSMYALVKRVSVRTPIALGTALFYMMTFSIQYWTFRQGFSSWGAAFMPWCLIPAIDFLKNKQIGVLRLALAVSIMLQVHMLSAFLLICAYVPMYLYGLIRFPNKWDIIKKGTLAVIITLVLCLNLWVALAEVGMSNSLVQPFINSDLYIMTVNQRSIQWLETPYPLLYLVLYHLYFTFRKGKYFDELLKVVTGTYFVFLVLASSAFPWYKVAQWNLSIVNLIQFPFRFFIPATSLLLLATALILHRYFVVKWPKWVGVVLAVVLLFSYKQTVQEDMAALNRFNQSDTPIQDQKHQFVSEEDEAVRQAFFATDLEELLNLAEKSTPDYLPADEENTENKYNLYEEYVLGNELALTTHQEKGKLLLNWTAEQDGLVSLPIVKYAHTRVVLNGVELKEGDYSLSPIGTLSVEAQKGTNTIELSYQVGAWFNAVIVGNLLLWILFLSYLAFQRLKRTRLNPTNP